MNTVISHERGISGHQQLMETLRKRIEKTEEGMSLFSLLLSPGRERERVCVM